jgi:hypothetical protein
VSYRDTGLGIDVGESPWLREIRTLDAERDCRRIVFLDTFHVFPFDTTRALELAFFKTFAVPTIAERLRSTGEFTERGQKRYDDTDLLISAFSQDGWDGELGKRALRRMNQVHSRFPIANDDYIYVLSSLVLEPMRFNARFGWRRRIETEQQAHYYFWREIGRRMGIREIPDSLAELERYNLAYERERFARTEAGCQLAQAQRDVFLAWFPWVPHRLGARAISALLEEHVVEALGLVRPTRVERRLAAGALRLRSRVVRVLPARRQPHLRTELRRRSYPTGYTIEGLGPPSKAD